MIKLMFCLRRHPSLTREEFLAHWRGPHADLGVAGAAALGARRYVQNHTLTHDLNDALQASRQAPAPFDGVVELWFDSTDAVATTFTDEEARRAVRALVKDEPAFIDLENSPIFLTEEHEIWDSTT